MIELEQRGEISILRMVRGKGNALSLDFLQALMDAFEQIDHSPTRAAIITGQGNVFCAGVDLPTLAEGGPSYVGKFLPTMTRFFERVATFPKPVVAAVNGHAIAGGAILTFACDQRLMARGSARIGLTEVLVGVQFPAWALELARFATPPEHFSTLICTGRTWQPDDSLARGLVDELVTSEQLIDRSCDVAREMAAIAPRTFAANKLALRRPMIKAAQHQTELERQSIVEDWCSPDVQRNIAEFVSRTIKK